MIAAAALQFARQLRHELAPVVGTRERVRDREQPVAFVGGAQRVFEIENPASGVQARE